MKKAHIVTDIGFGDSGKGVITDRIAARVATPNNSVAVIRHTGGSQAGHTVDLNLTGETDPNKRHIHSSFASGTLGGFYSHMSSYCPIFPQNLVREGLALAEKCGRGNRECSVDPLAPMITIYDVAWNRSWDGEFADACNTCGLGVGATMERMLTSDIKTFMSDLLDMNILNHKLKRVLRYYAAKLAGQPLRVHAAFKAVVEAEAESPDSALHFIHLKPTRSVIASYDEIIFEGAQGIILDQDHGFIPHVTWGYTTSRNAVEMITQAGGNCIVQAHHITRAYQTRHGDGPVTYMRPITVPPDPTNYTNVWQGDFRTGELDVPLLAYARDVDKAYLAALPPTCDVYPHQLHITCCDHLDAVELGKVVDYIRARAPWPIVNCWHGANRNQPLERQTWSL